jgi:peroxiredoxin Q/BCP
MAKIEVGKIVPDFTALSSGQKDETESPGFELKNFKGKKVVLYFYPKDSTPGCTLEGQDFNQLLPKFKKLNAEIFGISRDSLKSHGQFIHRCGFKFDLLSDPDETICQLFDVIKEKNMYGKKVLGIERSTFILNEKQQLAAEFRKVKAKGHAAEVLAAVKNLVISN